MAVLVRKLLLAALSLLLLQAVFCEDAASEDATPTKETKSGTESPAANEEDTSKNEPVRKGPMTWDELSYTRLEEVNKCAKKIAGLIDNTKKELAAPEATMSRIKSLRSIPMVNKSTKEIIENLGKNCGSKKKIMMSNLCAMAKRVKSYMKSVFSLTTILAEDERPEFLEIMNFDDTSSVADKVKCLTSSETPVALTEEDINKKINLSEYPENLYGRKTLSAKKIHVASEFLQSKLLACSEASNFALNAFYDALIALKNIQRELKSTQQYPDNIQEEESKIKTAVAVGKAIGCMKTKSESKKEED